MKNSVAGRANAQCSCAGHFIEQHLQNGPEFEGDWIHVDMAYPWNDNPQTEGRASGYGPALLAKLFSADLTKNQDLFKL